MQIHGTHAHLRMTNEQHVLCALVNTLGFMVTEVVGGIRSDLLAKVPNIAPCCAAAAGICRTNSESSATPFS